MVVDPSSPPDHYEELRKFALPFDPKNLLEEAHESTILEEKDKYNETDVCAFMQSAPLDVLREISYYCMEDPRLWDVYWEVIYDAALEVQEKMAAPKEDA